MYLAYRMKRQDHLPNMCQALELYAGPFDFCGHFVQKANDAVESGNVKRFKKLRAQIVQQVTTHMEDTECHLYAHDSEGETDLEDPTTPEFEMGAEEETDAEGEGDVEDESDAEGESGLEDEGGLEDESYFGGERY